MADVAPASPLRVTIRHSRPPHHPPPRLRLCRGNEEASPTGVTRTTHTAAARRRWRRRRPSSDARQVVCRVGVEDGVNACASVFAHVDAGAVNGRVEVTRSDELFKRDGVQFCVVADNDEINLDELNDLFAKVNFPRRPHDKLTTAIRNSYSVLCATAANKSRWAKKGQVRVMACQQLRITTRDFARSPCAIQLRHSTHSCAMQAFCVCARQHSVRGLGWGWGRPHNESMWLTSVFPRMQRRLSVLLVRRRTERSTPPYGMWPLIRRGRKLVSGEVLLSARCSCFRRMKSKASPSLENRRSSACTKSWASSANWTASKVWP